MVSSLAASGRRASTQSLYRSLLRKHVVPRLGTRALGTITGADVEALLLALEPTLAASTRRSLYAALRAVFDTAVRDRLLATNPVAAVRRPKLPVREAGHLEPGQLHALLDAAREDPLGPLWVLLAGTGMRRGEALALRWADVELDGGQLRVRRTLGRVDGVGIVENEPKTQQSRRTIALAGPVVEALRAHRVGQVQNRLAAGSAWQDEGRVFTTRNWDRAGPSERGPSVQGPGGQGRVPGCHAPHVAPHGRHVAT